MDELLLRIEKDPSSEILTIAKGTVLQKPGDKHHRGYYVKKGLLRSYTMDEKGKEHIFMFAPEGWIVSDIESMAYDSPAELFIDVLEDSEVYQIKQNLFDAGGGENLINTEFIRLARRIGVLQRRIIMLMSAPAVERYEHFIKTYPDMVNRIPQKMIASYLGITPEALSKIRNEKYKK